MTSRTTPVVLRPAWILLLLGLLLAAVVAAIGIGSRNDAPVVVVASPTASPAPTATAASTIVLRRAPDNLGCDSIASTYSSATIRIDPSAAEQVWAEIDTLVPDPPDPENPTLVGDRRQVYWSPSFSGGDASDPTVRDSSGAVVARDGTRTGELQPPYYLCAGNGPIYVLEPRQAAADPRATARSGIGRARDSPSRSCPIGESADGPSERGGSSSEGTDS